MPAPGHDGYRRVQLSRRAVAKLAGAIADLGPFLRRFLDRLQRQTAPARGPEGASFAHGTH